MNTPISACEARKQKKGGAALASIPTPTVLIKNPEVEVTRVRVTSEIPVVLVPFDEVPETTEVAPMDVQGAEVPEAEEARAPGVE